MTDASQDSKMAADVDDPAVVRAELEKLGEPGVDSDELSFHRAGARPDADGDVATVSTLFTVGYTAPDTRVLSEIENRRTWNRVADRLQSSGFNVARAVGSKSVWRSVVAGLAMAAGVALVPRLIPGGPAANVGAKPSAAEQAALESMGKSVRSRLDALDADFDGARAQSLAAKYGDRLRGEQEAP